MPKFLRDYDLTHGSYFLFDLFYYLTYGEFYDWKNQNILYSQSNNKSLRKDINADFYEGFND